MKQITAIVRPEMLEPLKDALTSAGVHGMAVSEVQGFGNQRGWKEFYRGTEVLLNMVPKVKMWRMGKSRSLSTSFARSLRRARLATARFS